MHALYAGSLGLAAALVGSLAAPPTAQATEPTSPEPLAQPATEALAAAVNADLVDSELPSNAELDDAAPPACDGKCKVLALTEKALPGFGAAQIIGVLLYPEERGVSINSSDGTPALTFTVMPTKIGRGQGLVAIHRF
jgi:hypothetical protein